MDEREVERLVRETYGDMTVPPLRAREPKRSRLPLAVAAALVAAIVIGIGIGGTLSRLRSSPASAPAADAYAVLLVEGSAERFRIVDTDGRTVATIDEGSTRDITAVTPSPDGRLVAYWRSTPTDAELVVWDVATAQIREISRTDEGGGGIIWAPDSTSFVTTAVLERAFEAPPRRAVVLRVAVDGGTTELLRVADSEPPMLIAFDGTTAAALFGRSPREATYGRIRADGGGVQTSGVGAPLPSTFANPRSQERTTVAGNFKEFESVEPNDIRVWQLDSMDPPLARHLERGGEGALLWPGRAAVLFVNMSGPGRGTLKALHYGSAQRVADLGATDGVPLGFDPLGRWLLTTAPSVHPVRGDSVEGARSLQAPPSMRAIGWVISGAAGRLPPPTPEPPSCARAGTSAEDVLRAFLNEVREGDVNGMTACWSAGRFSFADASAYTRTRLLGGEIERFGSEARDVDGRLILGFRVRASWEFRERSPWRADGGCCERVFLVRQLEGGTWRIDSSQTVSAKLPPDVCAARSALLPEQVVEIWFTLLADERAADMATCWADATTDRAALMRSYVDTGGTSRLEIGPTTPTRSGAAAVRVVADWRTSGFGGWSNGQAKWLIVRRQAGGRWAIESTATALAPDAQ